MKTLDLKKNIQHIDDSYIILNIHFSPSCAHKIICIISVVRCVCHFSQCIYYVHTNISVWIATKHRWWLSIPNSCAGSQLTSSKATHCLIDIQHLQAKFISSLCHQRFRCHKNKHVYMPHMAVVYVTPNCHQCGIYDNVDAGAAFGILTHFPVSLRLNKFQFRGKWVLCLHLSVALIHIFLFNFIYLKFSNFFYRVDRFQRLRYAIRWFRNDFVINKKKFVHTN